MLRGVQVRFGLVVILLAGNSRVVQFLRAFPLDLGEFDARFLRVARGFLAANGGLLFQGVDLHQRGSGFDRAAGFTKMPVACPSTWGLSITDWRDLRVPRYSEDSGIATGAIIAVLTGIAGCCSLPAACFWSQPDRSAPRQTTDVASANARTRVFFEGLNGPIMETVLYRGFTAPRTQTHIKIIYRRAEPKEDRRALRSTTYKVVIFFTIL